MLVKFASTDAGAPRCLQLLVDGSERYRPSFSTRGDPTDVVCEVRDGGSGAVLPIGFDGVSSGAGGSLTLALSLLPIGISFRRIVWTSMVVTVVEQQNQAEWDAWHNILPKAVLSGARDMLELGIWVPTFCTALL